MFLEAAVAEPCLSPLVPSPEALYIIIQCSVPSGLLAVVALLFFRWVKQTSTQPASSPVGFGDSAASIEQVGQLCFPTLPPGDGRITGRAHHVLGFAFTDDDDTAGDENS